MKCYSHRTIDAIGICKSCQRGLCPDCVVEVGTSCSCKNRCEKDVEILNEMILRGSRNHLKTSGAIVRAGLFSCATGMVFLGFSYVMRDHGQFDYFLLIAGAVFLVYGISQFFSAKRYRDKN